MLFPQGKSRDRSFESSHYVERTRDGSLLHPSQYVIAPAARSTSLDHPALGFDKERLNSTVVASVEPASILIHKLHFIKTRELARVPVLCTRCSAIYF